MYAHARHGVCVCVCLYVCEGLSHGIMRQGIMYILNIAQCVWFLNKRREAQQCHVCGQQVLGSANCRGPAAGTTSVSEWCCSNLYKIEAVLMFP